MTPDRCRQQVRIMEYTLQMQQQVAAQGTLPWLGDLIVVDCAALAWKHIDFKLLKISAPLIALWQNHYPEVLYRVYIINAPKLFEVVWRVIRPMLNELVVRRVVIAAHDCAADLAELLPEGTAGGGDDRQEEGEGLATRLHPSVRLLAAERHRATVADPRRP